MREWKPPDVIALVAVVTCATLLMSGRDSVVSYALVGVVVCYFGIDLSGIIRRNRHKRGK